MTRRIARPLLWAALLLPLAAAPAAASSITTYGSIMITSFGTNGLKIDILDEKAGGPTGDPNGPTIPVDTGGGAMPTTVGGVDVKPGVGATGHPDAGGGTERPTSGDTGGSTGPETPDTPTEEVADKDPPPTPPIDLTTTTVEVPAPTSTPEVEMSGPAPAGGGDIETVRGPKGTAHTPEPASLTLLAVAGLGGWGYTRRRRATG